MKKRGTILNIIIIILLLTIIVATCIGMYAWAKYTSRIEGNAEAQVAKWSFKVVDGITETTDVIDFAFTRTDGYGKVVEGRLAPGTFGEFEIGIDARGTETTLKYTIEAVLNNKPTNLKLYSDEAKTEEITFTNNKFIISDYMNLDDVKAIKEVKLYWEWPYESGQDLQDTQDAGKAVSMQISVTGTQVLEVPPREISFTISGNEYKVKEGMTWREWDNSPDYDSTGFIVDRGDGEDVVYTANYRYYVKINDVDEPIIGGINYELGSVNWPL